MGDCQTEFEYQAPFDERAVCRVCGWEGLWRPDTDELLSEAVIDAEKHEWEEDPRHDL